MIIGGHVSAAGAINKAVERAIAEGFEAMQLFPSPPQGYRPIAYTPSQGTDFKKKWQQAGIKAVFFHAIYLLNLASPREDLVKRSIASLVNYLRFGHDCGTVGTIFHVGSRGNDSLPIEQIIDAMKEVLQKTPDDQYLIMENAAGGGGRVGVSLEELVQMYTGVNSPRLKLCIDTQHLFSSGIDVRDTKQFSAWLNRFNKEIGIEQLVCVHANDSKTPFASAKDRHENIGAGAIGLEGFRHIIAQPLLRDKPYILEVPGFENTGPDAKNRKILQSLI